MMAENCACRRCGYESTCSHGRWWDRHPYAAVLFALPAGYTLIGVMLVYPWFTIPATIIVSAALLNRAARKRAAIAARADWEHREMMVRAMQQFPDRSLPPLPPPVQPRNPALWNVITQWPTRPIRKANGR